MDPMKAVYALFVCMGVLACVAITLIVWVLSLQAQLKEAQEAKRLAMRGPRALVYLPAGRYKLVNVYYVARHGFGTGEVESSRSGVMQVQDEQEHVHMVEFRLEQYDDVTPLINGVDIEVTKTDGVTLFKCVN